MNDSRWNALPGDERLEAELEQQMNQFAVLNQIAQTVTSNVDLPHMLTAISEAACHIFPGMSIAIGTINESKDRLVFVMDFPPTPEKEALTGTALPIDYASPISIALLRKQTPIVIANAETEPILAHLHSIATRFHIKTAVLLPLITHSDVLGVVMFYGQNRYRPFPPKDLALAQTIASQLAGVIHHAQLFEQERRQRERAEMLQNVSMILNSSLDEQTVLKKILEQAHRVVPHDASAVFLKKGENLVLSSGTNVPEQFLNRQIPLDNGTYLSEVFLTRQPILLIDAHAAPRWDKWVEDSQIRSWIGVPMYVGEHGIGILTVDYHEPDAYREDDARLLSVLGNHAALAIHNAQLYREIRQEKQFFETLLINSPVATAITDLDFRVTSLNPAAERLFGYTAQEALGKSLYHLIAPLKQADEKNDGVNRLKERQLVRTITRRQIRSGQIIDVELHASPVILEDNVAAYITQYHDITELEQARKNSETANRVKSAFFANMSHELRTPLTAILGFGELLLRSKKLPAEETTYVEIIHRNGEHLLLLLNNLLDLARMETGQIVLNERNFNLHRLLDELYARLSSRAEHEYVRLSFRRDPGVPQYIRTDEIKLHQVLLHLMTDILKCTNRGEVELSIRFRPASAGNADKSHLCFEIVSRSFYPLVEDENLLPITRQFVRLIGGELRVLPIEEALGHPFDALSGNFLCLAFDIPVGASLVEEARTEPSWKTPSLTAQIDWTSSDALPLEFWKRFEYAVTAVDMTEIAACVCELRRYAPEAACAFAQLHHDFEYVNMMALIREAKTRKGETS